MNEILTAILVVVTAVYAWVTFRIMRANERSTAIASKQTEDSLRPYVYYDFSYDPPCIDGRLENFGKTAAYDISVSLEPSLGVVHSKKKGSGCIIDHPTSYLPPTRQIVEFLGTWDEVTANDTNLVYHGSITYRDGAGQQYSEAFTIDLHSRHDMLHTPPPCAAEELKKLNDRVRDVVRAIEKR